VRYFGKVIIQILSAGLSHLQAQSGFGSSADSQPEARFLERNPELSLIAGEINELSGPTILVGDLTADRGRSAFAERNLT
jgi:hypothetical protein